MAQFRRERDIKTTQLAAETNRLIIRVERVRERERFSILYNSPSDVTAAVPSSASDSIENTKG